MDSRREVITLHSCRRRCPPCSGLLQNPNRLPALPSPRCVGGDGALSLEAQGLLLVPRPRSRITGPPPRGKILFSVCLPWPLWSRAVLACLLCCSFLSLRSYWHKMFLKMLMIMLSVWCAWRVKTKYKRLKKAIKCLQVLCRIWGGG